MLAGVVILSLNGMYLCCDVLRRGAELVMTRQLSAGTTHLPALQSRSMAVGRNGLNGKLGRTMLSHCHCHKNTCVFSFSLRDWLSPTTHDIDQQETSQPPQCRHKQRRYGDVDRLYQEFLYITTPEAIRDNNKSTEYRCHRCCSWQGGRFS